jgi:FKBP-type peptidyl-prolyl cis-trans isomerase
MLCVSCTAESVKSKLLQQEQNINTYIENAKKNGATVDYLDNACRIVLSVGNGKSAASGDSVIFRYKSYILSSNTKGSLYDSSAVEIGVLGTSSYVSGVENGLTGMCSKEHAEIVLTGKNSYGNVSIGILPPYTSIIFEVWMDTVIVKK